MELLDLYRSRFGDAVKRQGNGWNGPCPLCGGQPGKSDRFMVWPDRSENLGESCSRHGIRGIWSCRQCGESGDTIAYLMKAEGMSFREALADLGIEGEKKPWRRGRAPSEPVGRVAAWSPKDMADPAAEWRCASLKLVEEAERRIWDKPQALEWLMARGIGSYAVTRYRLGYLEAEGEKYPGRFRPRKTFGLASKTCQNGKIRDKLFIPRGILIPTFNRAGEVLNLRIRRPRADLREGSPKYMEMEGSSHAPLFLPSSLPLALAVYFITEAELDAMLIHHASGGIVGAVAVRTNRGKPDSHCQRHLEAASRICIALDYDSAGAEGCDFWEENYANAIRWPVPEGKDPGDAFALGVDIREWIEVSLPASVSLPDNEPAIHGSTIAQENQETQAPIENGQLEASPSGKLALGEGAGPNHENKKVESRPEAKRDKMDIPSPAASPARQCMEIPAGLVSFCDLELPPRVRAQDLLQALAKAPLNDPECILPCPKTNPPFWWGYRRDCARFKCRGHPQCLLGILESDIFAQALEEYKKANPKKQ